MHGPCAEDHLPALDRRPLPVEADAHADGTPILDEHPIDQRVADDVQVRPVARGFEVRVVRGDSLLADWVTVDRVGRHALSSRRVVIGAPPVARGERCLAERTIDGAPPFLRDAEDRHRPFGAVPGVGAEVVFGLEPPIRGQHVVPRPSRHAPPVVVFGQGADREDPVDRRRSTDAASPPEQLRLLVARAPREQRRVLEVVELRVADDEPRVQRPDL